MQAWLSEHMLISYLLILGMTFFIFQKVFRPQQARLPLIREILMYATMIFGSAILLIMQIDKLPIIQCMAIAIVMMITLRLRQLYDGWKQKSSADSNANTETK